MPSSMKSGRPGMFHLSSVILAAALIGAVLPRPASSQPVVKRDSLYSEPHEQYLPRLYNSQPLPFQPVPRPLSKTTVTPPNINLSGQTDPQNEPSVKISRYDPNFVVAAWRDFRTGVIPAIRRVGYSYSTDAGQTWSTSDLIPPFSLAYPRTSDPAVGVDINGSFYIATISINTADANGRIAVYKSYDNGGSFWPLSVAPSDTFPSDFDDKEYITCDVDLSSPYAGAIYISWTRFGSPGGMFLTRSFDGGQTWSPHTVINDPGNAGQGSDPCVGPDGSVNVVWSGGAGIMFDRSSNAGVSFGTDVVVDTIHAGENGFPAIAADLSSGPRRGYLYTVFSDARNGDYDVFLCASSDGGAHWSPARRVNDDPLSNGKDQFWPWIAVDDVGIVSIVYYDTRNTPNNGITETYYARSSDGGVTFRNMLLSSAQSPRNTPNGDVRYGDYIGIDAWNGRAIAVWTDERAGGFDMDIYTAPVDVFGTTQYSLRGGWNMVSVPALIADRSRQSLFPGSISSAFAYQGSYVAVETLSAGYGYWVKMPAETPITLHGDSLLSDTAQVVEGWNMIGSLTSALPTSQVYSDSSGLTTSHYFGYNSSYYATDTIQPGLAYWVKANQPGNLILSLSGHGGGRNAVRIVPAAELPPSPPDAPAVRATPAEFALAQNYPNPFNPVTHLQFSIADLQFVSLKVFDLLGREVATLVNETKRPGKYTVEWDASTQPSGVYYCRLQAGSSLETKKLVLVR